MGQGTLGSEAVELQNSLFVFEIQSPACGHWVGWTLDFFAFVCFCVGQVYYLILFCRLGCSETQGLNLRKRMLVDSWGVHTVQRKIVWQWYPPGCNACLHLLGWTLAEELLTMLLKEWSGKKDLPKTSHPTPKEGKVFQSSAILTRLWTDTFLRWSDSHTHKTNAREGDSNLRISTYFYISICVCLYMFFRLYFLDLSCLPCMDWPTQALVPLFVLIQGLAPPPTDRCC